LQLCNNQRNYARRKRSRNNSFRDLSPAY